MEKTDNTSIGSAFPGSVPMAKIDGAGIRRIREAKGLTQLYLATVIGVTTDTISRWENRRYPSIKLENAEKLAQALEVDLAAILEREHEEGQPAIDQMETGGDSVPLPVAESPPHPPSPSVELAPSAPPIRRSFLVWLLPVLLVVTLGVLSLWRTTPGPPGPSVAAQRILPAHVPPGQTFPVMIRVGTSQKASVALILKESVPPGCRIMNGEPPFTSVDGKSGALKWISRTAEGQDTTTLSYVLQAPAKGVEGDQLRFSGGVTLNQADQPQAEIGGATAMVLSPYHWADVDRNGRIDDEEILAVYDRYSVLEKLDFDRDLIDSIWASGGYTWERKTGKYVLRE